MKIQGIIAGLVGTLMVVGVWSAEAKGPARVANTIHNLSTSAPVLPSTAPARHQYWSDEEEICIFCHTPHGGTITGPLWNHVDAAPAAWTHYSSTTISTYLAGLAADRAPSDETLLCMTCHDGSVSVYSLHNYSNDLPVITNLHNGQTDMSIIAGMPPRIGEGPTDAYGDLSDDHPVSFSYDSVLVSPEYLSGGNKFNSLKTAAAALNGGNGIRFFGVGNRVECSTCHDPHVDYISNPQYTPFLIMSNGNSNLCLACHNK